MAYNYSDSPDIAYAEIQRTAWESGSIGVEGEYNAILYAVTVSAEVSFGQENTFTEGAQWSIPAWSTVLCEYGSETFTTEGQMQDWRFGRLYREYNVTETYTTRAIQRKTVQ